MTSTGATRPPTVLSARGPGDLVAVVPLLLGFVPRESLVLVGLRGRRRRTGLVVRADLASGDEPPGTSVRALRRDGARAVALLVHTEEPSGPGPLAHPRAALVDAVEDALAEHGVGLEPALLVRFGRWWSYRCAHDCCPPEGTPVDPDSPFARHAAAEQAFHGRAVLATREQLAGGLQADPVLGPAVARRLQQQAWTAREEHRDPAGRRREDRQRWRAAVEAWEQRPGAVDPAEVAALAVALHDVRVRDEVAGWGADRPEAVLGLLRHLCRGVVPPDDAPLCAALGWVAWADGQGAVALVAAQRALRTDPRLPLGRLLLAAVDAAAPPEAVRAVLRTAGDACARD